MVRRTEYAAISRIIYPSNKVGMGNDNVEIRIDFRNIPQEKRTQIEDAAHRLFALAEEVLSKEEAASGN